MSINGEDIDDDGFVDVGNNPSLSFLIVGRAGAGKTALANAVANDEVGRESTNLDSETKKFLEYSASWKSARAEITIWDTPGLQGESTKDKDVFLTQLESKADQCDLVIYCMRMDAVRLEKMDIENIQLISRALGKGFWHKTVVALTFANLVTCPPSHRNDEASEEKWFRQRTTDWETQVREVLYQASIPETIADEIQFVPVGYNKPTRYYPNPWRICCSRDWRYSFVEVLNGKLNSLNQEQETGSEDPLVLVLYEFQKEDSSCKAESGSSYADYAFDIVAGSAERIRIASGVSGGVAAGVGVAAGTLLSPGVAVVGGVAGAIGGAAVTYKMLTTVAENRDNAATKLPSLA